MQLAHKNALFPLTYISCHCCDYNYTEWGVDPWKQNHSLDGLGCGEAVILAQLKKDGREKGHIIMFTQS